jgi:hypothetical protein
MFRDPYDLLNESTISLAKVSTTAYQAQIYSAETTCMEVATDEKFMSKLQLVFFL